MPALINIACNLVLGSAVALAVKGSVAMRRELVSWPLLALVGFEALVFVPVSTFLFRFYPQWSMLYVFDPQISPMLENWIGLLSFVAAAVGIGAAIGAFYLTRAGILRNNRRLSYAASTIGVVADLIVVVLFGKRLVFIGDYDAYWQGNADLFLLRVGGWMGVLMYASAVAFVLFLHKRFAHRDPSFV